MAGRWEPKIRAGWAAANRRDLDRILEFLDPDIRWDLSLAFPDGPVYHGHDGVRRFFDQAFRMWDDFRITVDEVHEVADRAVVVGWWSGTGHLSAVPLRQRGGWLFEFDGPLAVRMRFYWDPDEALVVMAAEPLPVAAPLAVAA